MEENKEKELEFTQVTSDEADDGICVGPDNCPWSECTVR